MSVSFIFYETFAKQLKLLDKELRYRFYEAIIEYGLYGTVPDFTGLEACAWLPIQEAIDNAKARRIKNTEDGKRGGRPEIPQEIQQAVCEDLQAGMTQKEIAEKHGVSQQVVSKIKKKVYGTTYCKPSSNTTNLDVDVDVDVNDNDNDNVDEIVSPPEAPDGDVKPSPVKKTQTIPEQAERLAHLLYDLHRQVDPHFTTSQKHIEQWAKDIEKLSRIDKRSYEDIEKVIRWAKTADNFWCPNIISGSKLRKKYPQVFLQMQQQYARSPPEGKYKRFDCNVTGAQEEMPF
nr:MAG TPA: replication protein O [Caudoviricetes sp.]